MIRNISFIPLNNRHIFLYCTVILFLLLTINNKKSFAKTASTESSGDNKPVVLNSHGTKEMAKSKVPDSYGKIPLYFIKNEGQLNESIEFYENGFGRSTFFKKDGIYISLINSDSTSFRGQKFKSRNRKKYGRGEAYEKNNRKRDNEKESPKSKYNMKNEREHKTEEVKETKDDYKL